jgi:hypothetical protein
MQPSQSPFRLGTGTSQPLKMRYFHAHDTKIVTMIVVMEIAADVVREKSTTPVGRVCFMAQTSKRKGEK